MLAIFDVVLLVLQLYWWIIIASAVMSWLIAFGIVDTRNRFVYLVADTLNRLTEPALRPIRNLLPNLGGIDISPIILLLIIYFVQQFILRTFYY
ncbi:MAG: YggT family protein [Rhodobiaceae bacterium]|nr:YggT family protein [Rhodobiaceae bacterium]